VGGLYKDNVGAAIVGCNSDGFVKEAVEMLDGNSFVIASSSDVDVDMQNLADGLKEALKSTAIVDDDETTKADFQKDLLDEQTSKIVGSDVAGGGNKNEPGKIAHSVQEISFSTIISDVARRPKIDMEDVKGATEGPRENELTVASDSAIGGDTVRALENPVGNILATLRPEEAKTNAMKSLVDAHVAGGGGSMVSGEDVATKGERDNN
jgi:hypothetical protein